MSQPVFANEAPLAPAQRLIRSHFDVREHASHRPIVAWRERVGHVIDLKLSLAEVDRPFQGSIDRYGIGDVAFTDCITDSMLLERSVARISTDSNRDYAFHVFIDGGVDNMTVRSAPRGEATPNASIVALDLGQPFRMRRRACRVLTFFVPGAMVEEVFPDPELIHGRMLANDTPLTQLIVEHVSAINRNIAGMNAAEASEAIRSSAQLLVSAFGKRAGVSGSARAAVRSAVIGRVRRYILAHLRDDELTPERVLEALQLPRATLYRLFQHDGGLGAYIRNLRLRHAASELVARPNVSVTEIAFGLGFKSSSDFTRAFRRAYEMTPRDFRNNSAKA